jgi:hypothetical protein
LTCFNDDECLIDNKNYIYYENNDEFSYEKMSCYDDNLREKICLDGYYYDNNLNKCVNCNISNCKICLDEKCVSCKENFLLSNSICIEKKNDKNCVEYNKYNKCLKCKKNCKLDSNKNKCICSNAVLYVLIFLAIFFVLLVLMVVLFIKKRKEIINLINAENNFVDMNIIEEKKLKQSEIQKIIEIDKKLKKCDFCCNEIAVALFDCGHLMCVNEIKYLNNNDNNDNNDNDNNNNNNNN